MKKVYLAMAAVAMALTGCTNSMDEAMEQAQPVKFNISVEVEGQTRAVKSTWENGDKIFLCNSKYSDKFQLELIDGKWEPNSDLLKETQFSWNKYYTDAKWGAVWTSNSEAFRNGINFNLGGGYISGQETLVAKEGTSITMEGDVMTIKLVMGQPADFCKVTVEGLNDDSYALQVTGAYDTHNLQYMYDTDAYTLTVENRSINARNYYFEGSSWTFDSMYSYAASGKVEEGNMTYFVKSDGGTVKTTTYFVLAYRDEKDTSGATKATSLNYATKIFCKKVEKAMPWATGHGVKIKGPVNLDMEVSTGWDAKDANDWVRVW